ncbi:major facilitator superfamily transporter [Thozetella sp. PMI_491]|nr:major facilitator superfamily transporter [Thozetella sp. PMI_491]
MKFGELAFAKRHKRSPEESNLVRRLDIFLMTFGCISQVIKCKDQTNINNAYVSGMKEDLNLIGNELNLQTWFNVAYCLMLIPSQIILTYVRPSFWLSGLEICWGVITGLIATTTNANQVYVLRAFLGLCESSAWPGMMTLLMHWYTPTELAKRMGFYHSCQAIGSMMSGAIQVGIMSTLNGSHGIAGWRWLFIINAILTVIVGLCGVFLLPDVPNNVNPRAFWFKKEHARLAMERLERHGRAEPKKISWAGAKRSFSSWILYYIAALYVATVVASWGYSYFSLFLKSLKNPDGSSVWTVTQINGIPIGGSAINVVFVWIWAISSDLLGTRWILIVAQAAIGVMVCIMMTVWTSHPKSVPLATAYAGYFLAYVCLGTAPLIFAWLSDLLPQDPEARTLTTGVAVAMYYAVSAWSQVLVWPAVEAPYYRYGWQSSMALWILVIILTCVLRYVDLKFLLPKRNAFMATVIEGSDIDKPDSQDRLDRDSAPDTKAPGPIGAVSGSREI